MRGTTLLSFTGSIFSIGKLHFVGTFCSWKLLPERLLLLEIVLALVVDFIFFALDAVVVGEPLDSSLML
jgi:hypothetical protein